MTGAYLRHELPKFRAVLEAASLFLFKFFFLPIARAPKDIEKKKGSYEDLSLSFILFYQSPNLVHLLDFRDISVGQMIRYSAGQC